MRTATAIVAVIVLAALVGIARADSSWGEYNLDGQLSTPTGWSASLTFVAGATPCPYGVPISPLNIEVSYVTSNSARIKIYDPAVARWQVPNIVTIPSELSSFPNYTVTILTATPFRLQVARKNGNVIFDSRQLIFANQYLQFGSTMKPNSNIYGLGERVSQLRFDTSKEQAFSFIASDHGTPLKRPLYGSHPIYYQVVPGINGTASETHGVFLLNSNPMDAIVGPDRVEFKTVGGIIDLFVFIGPTPDAVAKQYQVLVGNPAMPPEWSLGYHQCRWGYKDVDAIQYVVDQFKIHDLPVTTFWVDIDYMQEWRVFTSDPVNFPATKFGDFVRTLHANNQRFVPIIDPGVRIADPADYPAYADGLAANVFIRDPDGVNYTIGKVWPGLVSFVDWTHPNASEYWTSHTRAWHEIVPIDGMWTDMNEVASFCDGRCKLTLAHDDHTGPSDDNLFRCNCTERFDTGTWDDPPYTPVDTRDRVCRSAPYTNDSIHGLDCGTISMASHLYGGRSYNLHNLFGHNEAVITAQALMDIRHQRPFVLTRSTFPGSGKHVSHWLGDNDSTWAAMRQSIAGMLNMNLFGIPHVGADVCGFGGNSTAPLCQRWMQLGAFSPFFRNHNQEKMISQEPYAFGEAVLNSSRSVMKTRMSLISYWRTLFAHVHTHGGTVQRPLFYEYPNDVATYGIDDQFLVGSCLLVSPVLDEGSVQVSAYFPIGTTWVNFFKKDFTIRSSDGHRSLLLNTPMSDIQVHQRSGCIVPVQDPTLNTEVLKVSPTTLHIVMNPVDTSAAVGSLYVDDGESLDTFEKKDYTTLHFEAVWSSAKKEVLSISSRVTNIQFTRMMNIKGVIVSGACQPTSVTVKSTGGNLTATVTPVGTSNGDTYSASFDGISILTDWNMKWNCQGSVDPTKDDDFPLLTGILIGAGAGVGIIACIIGLYCLNKKKSNEEDFHSLPTNSDPYHG